MQATFKEQVVLRIEPKIVLRIAGYRLYGHKTNKKGKPACAFNNQIFIRKKK